MTDKTLDREIFDKAMKKIGYGTMTIQLELDKANVFYGVIFTHWFAKAFWGEDNYYYFSEGSLYHAEDNTPMIFSYSNIEAQDELHLIEDGNKHKGNYHWYLPAWQYHLQQMVLEEEPLKYLEKFL